MYFTCYLVPKYLSKPVLAGTCLQWDWAKDDFIKRAKPSFKGPHIRYYNKLYYVYVWHSGREDTWKMFLTFELRSENRIGWNFLPVGNAPQRINKGKCLAWQLKHSSVCLYLIWECLSLSTSSVSNSTFVLQWTWGQQCWFKCMGSCHPCGRPRLCLWLQGM